MGVNCEEMPKVDIFCEDFVMLEGPGNSAGHLNRYDKSGVDARLRQQPQSANGNNHSGEAHRAGLVTQAKTRGDSQPVQRHG